MGSVMCNLVEFLTTSARHGRGVLMIDARRAGELSAGALFETHWGPVVGALMVQMTKRLYRQGFVIPMVVEM
jgi:hypothetical protein